MQEERIFFKSDELIIEGVYHNGSGDAGVLICHPHPQMGGDMNNNVVNALAASFREMGIATLRFNFRGVGHSEGHYDKGKGETSDVVAAYDYLLKKDKKTILASGYSFGAVMVLNALPRMAAVENIIAVSPPLSMMTVHEGGNINARGLIICGDQDQFCNTSSFKSLLDSGAYELTVVNGADHFYLGFEEEIKYEISRYLVKK